MSAASKPSKRIAKPKVHGSKGVYCGGDWVPIEDCGGWINGCPANDPSNSLPSLSNVRNLDDLTTLYDIAIIGAGCIGCSIARELSKYNLNIILLERDDDVTQGATKGNSGIVHAGYDDKPGSVRAQFCWPGNQMFEQLDRELRFGYLKNGSLVVAKSESEKKHLNELLERGDKNGVKNLRIVNNEELHTMEPHLSKDYIAGLYSPDAATITPYEFTIALAENAAMNGVQIRSRHEVKNINFDEKQSEFDIFVKEWSYQATSDKNNVEMDEAARRLFKEPEKKSIDTTSAILALLVAVAVPATYVYFNAMVAAGVGALGSLSVAYLFTQSGSNSSVAPVTTGNAGSGDHDNEENGGFTKKIRAKYVINSAGLFADKIAGMIGDKSFKIKPRLGEYILLDKTQGHLANCTLFPVPDPHLGKGVLAQTTLWGNLILGPTARDVHDPEHMKLSKDDVMKYILSRTVGMIPEIDATKVIHSFAGARAKSSRKDWIIEKSEKNNKFINVAGIDSPGLAGSPAIAVYVVQMLQDASQSDNKFKMNKKDNFEPNRRPTIFPKRGWVGVKLKQYDQSSSVKKNRTEEEMKKNVVCKCEIVTEYEIVDAINRCGVSVDTTQALRRRTRAGMGHCQADASNVDCEKHVAAIIAREKGIKENQVGRRPWPATSLLSQRWLNDNDKDHLVALAKG